MKNAEPWIEKIIKNYVATSGENNLRNAANDKAWAEPLVGFSRGDDPLFEFFKSDIGPFFWTPLEAFSLAFPASGAAPGELAVISWVLPQTEETKADNRIMDKLPAERWVRSRNFGEAFNMLLARHVVFALQGKGIQAVAPVQNPK